MKAGPTKIIMWPWVQVPVASDIEVFPGDSAVWPGWKNQWFYGSPSTLYPSVPPSSPPHTHLNRHFSFRETEVDKRFSISWKICFWESSFKHFTITGDK